MEKILSLLRDLFVRFLEEKFKAFRAGFLAGGVISLPFLFSLQNISRDLVWIFPLKLFMSTCFAFCTGLASHGAKSTWGCLARRFRVRQAKRINKRKNKSNGKAA